MKKTSKKSAGRGRPAGSINEETKTWLKQNHISEDVYKKILTKIKG